MDLDQLSPSDQLIAGTGIVLVVDLLFLPWHSIPVGPLDVAWAAVEHDHALLGVLALLLTAAVVVVTLLRASGSEAQLPDLLVTWDGAVRFGAAAALGLLVVKVALDTAHLGVGAWLGVLLAAGMVWGGHLGCRAERAGAGSHVAE